ncbi:MAG: phospholipase D family protein [Caulobacteraceae bacterium]
MTLTLQVPGAGNTLHAALVDAARGATGGFAAFAFATSTGIDAALAEPPVRKLLGTGQFQLVIGLDAITDTAAVAAIKTAKAALPNASISLFYNPKGGVLYHPKTMFFKRPAGGRCLTGSGNLTLGGLRNNWEAFWKADVSTADAAVLEAQWAKWVADHKDNLLPPDDPRVTAQAALNAKTRAKIQKALKETDTEALAALEEEAAEAASLNPFLIAEVPKNRPGQADFGMDTYQGFFGVTLGKPREVTFYQVRPDGSLAPPEHRHAVAVKSSNYRFEVEALSGLQHPVNDHFILVFERIGKSEYRYVLLKPGDAGHASVQKFLNDNYFVSGNSKRRVVVTRSDVQAAWADNPLLLH